MFCNFVQKVLAKNMIDHIQRADIVAETLNMNVGAGGKQFYSEYTLNHTRKGKNIQIGKSFTITFSEDKATLKYTLAGNLKERITDLAFMIEFIENQHICINDMVIPFIPSAEELESFDIEHAKAHLEYLQTIQEVLDNLGISTPLDIDKMSDKDENNIRMLIAAFKHNKPVTFKGKDIPPVAPLDIANLKILLLIKPIEEGMRYQLYNFFDKHIDVSAQTEDGMMDQTSQYTILNEESFLTSSNMNISKVVTELCSYKNKIHYNRVNFCVLDMLKAYDKNKDGSLLDAAKQVTEWLIENDITMEDIYVINLYQCYLRERKLTTKEKGKIFSLLEKYSSAPKMQTGLYILLEDYEEAEQCMKQMSHEEMEEFKTYPLYSLFNKR